MGWTVRCYWKDSDRMEWHDYERHFDVDSSGEAGMAAGCEIGRRSIGSPVILVDSLCIISDGVPRSGWPERNVRPDEEPIRD